MRFTTFKFQALTAGAVNRVACAEVSEYYTWALSQRTKAKDVLSRARKHRYQPAPPYLVQRRHCHVDLPLLEQPVLVSKQKREQQRADVRAVHVSVRPVGRLLAVTARHVIACG